MNIADIDISGFKYKSAYADPDRVYYGLAACRFLGSDIITQVLHNRDMVCGYEPRYFSHLVGIDLCYYWTIAIDIDLLNFDNFEIVAVCTHNDIRIHYKNDKWFDNTDKLKGKESLTESAAIYKAMEYIIRELKYLYSNRSKTYCAILSEKYASDFEIEKEE